MNNRSLFTLTYLSSRILSCLVLLSLASCNPSSDRASIEETSPTPSGPNILLILVDDLGKEWISCYGAEDISTPNIDALAENGIRFTNFYTMPQCTPTRLSLLTGQYPFRHGWVNHWDVPRWGGGAHYDETENPSLGKVMKEAGYKTAIAGKWQVDDFRVEPDALEKHGFDAYCMWTGYETGVEASAKRYQDPYIFTKEGSKTYDGKFGPDVFRDFLIDFIRENKSEPMFIYYPMVLTHPPLVNTPDEAAETPIEKHKAMVRYTDKITGQLVEVLEAEGIRDNTLIIWTTDNGTSRGITGTRNGRKVEGAKAMTIEPGICVPFIANWPGTVEAGQVSDALIDITDIFPTFAELAGVEVGTEWVVNETYHKIDGKSYVEVLTRKTRESQKDWIMAMGGGNHAKLTRQGVENQYRYRDRVIRNKRYKLYVNAQRKPEKFIDLQKDREEQINLIDSIDSPNRQ